jgi:hypothetical protein
MATTAHHRTHGVIHSLSEPLISDSFVLYKVTELSIEEWQTERIAFVLRALDKSVTEFLGFGVGFKDLPLNGCLEVITSLL